MTKEKAGPNTLPFSVVSVDDEPIVHKMLARLIEESGLPVVFAGSARSGAEALELIPQLRPAICLLDIQMDDMNGLELAARLAEIPDYSPRIIYLTAYSSFEYAHKALKLGAVDYLLKPINRKELMSVLRSVVNHLQAQRLEMIELDQLKKRVKSILPAAAVDADAADEHKHVAIARNARRFIDEHFPEKITLADAAAQVHLSAGYLGTIFKTAMGISFRAYLRSVRIVRAREMLQDHSLNLSEIARAVGYADLNYFSEAFLAEVGIRPSEYRGEGKRWAK